MRRAPRGGGDKKRARRLAVWAIWPALALLAAGIVAFTMANPGKPARNTLIVASIPYWSFQDGTEAVMANRTTVNEVSPWIYGLTSAGQIVPQYDPGQGAAITADIARMRAAHLRIVPTIANMTGGAWDVQAVGRILRDPLLMRRHVAAIVALVLRSGYAGVDIDYEQLPASDRQSFTAFIGELAAALHAHGKVLSVAVLPDTPGQSGNSNSAEDYAAIGRLADQVRIMSYDDHWSTSAPGASAPIGWVRSVVQYATSQMPASKVVLGIPLYGLDWPADLPNAATLTWLQAVRLAGQHHVTVSYSEANQAPYFSYVSAGRRHVVWFEDGRSSAAKFQVARGAGLAGVFLWMYGSEDPATWTSLRAVLPIASAPVRGTSPAAR